MTPSSLTACVFCLLFLLTLPLLAPHAAAAKIYRWTDARGELVISDRPPDDQSIPYETVDMGGGGLRRPPAPADAGDAPPTPASADAGRAGPTGAGAVAKDPEICRAARNNLETLQGLARIRMKGPDGEFYYLSEEEKETEREQARRLIELHCE